MLILSNWVPNGLVSIVYGTDNTHCASIQDVGIDFGGGDIFMPEKLLDGADVIPFLLAISMWAGAECPACHSIMNFSKTTHLLQVALYLLLFPALSLFYKEQYIFGGLALLVLGANSVLVACFSKFTISSTGTHRA
jgi:hypothetical protein